MKANSSDDDDDNSSGPISVDEFLDRAGPIDVDAYMDPLTEARAQEVSTMMTLTETMKSVLSAASDLASRVKTEITEDVKIPEDVSKAPYESKTMEHRVLEKRKADHYDANSIIENNSVEHRVLKKCKSDDYNNNKSEIADNHTCEETEHSSSEETEEYSKRSDRSKRSNRSTDGPVIVQGVAIEAQDKEQELTYDNLISTLEQSMDQRQQDRQREREEKRKERYELAERKRVDKIMYFGVFCLVLEIVGASIAVENYQPLVECCDRSIFSTDEAVGDKWNKAFYLMGILFLPFVILIEIPTLIIAHETLFLFNPMVGYLLAMHMLYTTDVESAWAIFGLETVAVLGQSWVLTQMQRRPESLLHSTINYTMAAITAYMLLRLTRQGGYCIVDDRIQLVFSDQTCNTQCLDADSCFRCDGNNDESFIPKCFIQFPTDEVDGILDDKP